MAKTNASLVEALKKGTVSFTFTKSNGEFRKALGTLNPQVIAEAGIAVTPRDLEVAAASNRYIDLEKKGWRRYNETASL